MGHKGRWWTIDDNVVKDVPALVRFVQLHTQAAQVHFVGHSMGGMILTGVMAQGGDTARRIRSCTLLGSGCYLKGRLHACQPWLLPGTAWPWRERMSLRDGSMSHGPILLLAASVGSLLHALPALAPACAAVLSSCSTTPRCLCLDAVRWHAGALSSCAAESTWSFGPAGSRWQLLLPLMGLSRLMYTVPSGQLLRWYSRLCLTRCALPLVDELYVWPANTDPQLARDMMARNFSNISVGVSGARAEPRASWLWRMLARAACMPCHACALW